MIIQYTNYDGDWETNCSYCGKKQRDHQVTLGDYKGVRYVHRQPCPKEQHGMTKKAVVNGIKIRTFFLIYDIGKYLWNLIPFKTELKLIWQGIKHAFISIKALIYLNKNKPK